MGLPFHEGVYRPQEFHVLSGPGLRSGDHSFAANFDPELLDLVVEVPKSQSESVTEFELPLLFDQRPHEDPILEAWLGKTLDNPDKALVVLEARCLQKLQQAVEDQPEVCPVLRNLLSRFEASIAQWLSSWPQAEPWREGLTLCASCSQSAEMLELELHSVLALQGGMAPGPQQPPFLPESEEALDAFRQEAAAWLFKLEALYGLELINQPERLAQHPRLSMLSWELPEVEALLQCPYFRPPEMSVWRFARRWCLEGGGACAFRDEPEAGVPVTKESIDMAISKGLIWELLPPKEELVARSGGESDAQSQRSDGVANAASGGAEEVAAEVPEEETTTSISGSSFLRLQRRNDCALKAFDDTAALHCRCRESAMVCWNSALEEQVVGGSRQVLASSCPMRRGEGTYRLDLRVNTSGDAAFLLEVGLMVSPDDVVAFKVDAPGACRPLRRGELPGKSEPFFRILSLMDVLVEGVRLAVDLDLKEDQVTLSNLEPGQTRAGEAISIAPWLAERNRAQVMSARNPGELECHLFKEHAEHLQELVNEGKLDGELADMFLADPGAKWVLAAEITPEVPEAYHFYISLPAGMEVEIF